MLATYHNHSTWSDGKTQPADLYARARALGVGELGVSDHFTLHPFGREVSWSMPPDRVGAYVQEVRGLDDRSQAAGGPVVRVGLEVDWFDDQAPALHRALADLPLDFAIGSVHFVGGVEIDGDPRVWVRLSEQQRDEVHRGYWRLVRQMAASGLFDIAAHLDLPKKFGFHPRSDLGDLIGEALDAVSEAGMVVELNTAGWQSPCREAYPSLQILRECRRRDIPVTLSADAHHPSHLLRHFAEGARCLADAGYDEVARFAARAVRLEPMAEAVPGET
ncbi:MAG: histidinol-phosphatase [Planctomycetota bacterium]|jgi:histidinol-phosphatase (PHP family)